MCKTKIHNNPQSNNIFRNKVAKANYPEKHALSTKILILVASDTFSTLLNEVFEETDLVSICSLSYDKKQAYKSVFVLGQNLKEYAFRNELVYLDTDFAKLVLGIVGAPIDSELKPLILLAIKLNGRIKSYSDDAHSIAVSHCFNLEFDQYLGQEHANKHGFIPSSFIFHCLVHIKKVILQSPAGTGKSTLCLLLASSIDKLKNVGIDTIIILEPTTPITRQLSMDFEKAGLVIAKIDGNSTKEDKNESADIIICCFDSFSQISKAILSSALVVVDEYHQLPIDFDYRNKPAFRYVLENIEKAKRVLMLSATPNYMFCQDKALHKFFGYTLIKGKPSIQNAIEVQPILNEGREKDLPIWIRENAPSGSGRVLGKLDSKSTLDALLIQNKEDTEVLHSGSADRKEDNKSYLSLMNTGKIENENIKYLWFTTLLEAGVSIKEEVKLMALLDVPSWQKAIQLMNRPRYNAATGTNKNLKVKIFRSAESEKNKVTPKAKKGKITPILSFKKEYEKAKDAAQKMNIIAINGFEFGINDIDDSKGKNIRTAADVRDQEKITYFDKAELKYKPCFLGVMRLLYEKETNVPWSLMLKRISRFDDRIKVLPIINVHPLKNEDFEAIKKAQKIDKEAANLKFKELLKKDNDMTAQAVCYLSKNADFKEKVRDSLNLSQVERGLVLEFVIDSDGAFSGKEPNRIISNLVALMGQTKSLSLSNAINFVLDNDKELVTDYISQVNRNLRNTAFRKMHLNAFTNFEFEREKYTCLAIDSLKQNIKNGRRSEWINLPTLTKIVNKATSKIPFGFNKLCKPLSDRKAIKVLKDIYNVESKRVKKKKKRTIYYKIGQKKTVKAFDNMLENGQKSDSKSNR